ncbi:MAG: hypothetical protein NTW85_06530 [Methylococcales bacterium]|nr:hypothetical protein [Methylococcales bacterium]
MLQSNFIEAVADTDGKIGLKYTIRVIRAGKSGNNNFYPDRVLRESVSLFDKARVFSKSDADHIQGKGKSFSQLIGQLTEPRFIEGQGVDSGEIQATLTLFASAGDVVAKLKEAYDNGMTELFGFSIDADGLTQQRGGLREATKFVKVHSVDLIIEPGAGGQLINLIEAVAPNQLEPQLQPQGGTMDLLQLMLAFIQVGNDGNMPKGLDTTDPVAVLAAYNETLEDDKKGRYWEAQEINALLTAAKLPTPVSEKLLKQFKATDSLTLESVREAIDAERSVLTKLTESGHIKGLGDTHVEMGKDRSEKVTAMFDDFFDRSKRAKSFRECYVEMTGDSGVTGLIQNCDTRRLKEALGSEESFREAISAATFGNILGNSITRAMVRDYNALENYNDFQDLVDVVPISNFRTQERTRMGGYGNLPAVAENAAYTALTSPSDEKSTYAITKRGGKETISLETIANDDVGAIRKVPQRLAVAAKRTLYEFVLDFMASNAAIYDTVALFHAVSHGNLGTAALDATSFAAARLAVKKQAEANSAKKLGLVLRHLYVPAELEEMAFNLFVRTTNLDESFVQSRKPKVHVVDYWSDTNNWFATADKMEAPLIELGFYNGTEEPELFVQDLPTQGSLFSNDDITYKIRHIYGGAVIDYRGFYAGIVA